MALIEFRSAAFDAPESVELIEAVQQEYVVRSGTRDETHLEARETGLHQPEAIALYESAGYLETEPFGYYADAPLTRHLAKGLAD